METSLSDFGPLAWSNPAIDVLGTRDDIGAGPANTAAIVAAVNVASQIGQAAQVADTINAGGFTDWFLPSIEELTAMIVNLDGLGLLGGFSNSVYWSSTQTTLVDAKVFSKTTLLTGSTRISHHLHQQGVQGCCLPKPNYSP